MRYEVLGGIEVLGEDGHVLPLGGPTQHRLLGTLLVEANHTVSIDHLVEALFDGAEPDNSVKAVRTYVSRLRGIVGEGTVATVAGGYRLCSEPGSLDAEQFSEFVRAASAARDGGDPARAVTLCEKALGLWQGRPFSPFSDEAWALGDVVRLEELRLVAKEERLDAQLALGAHAAVTGDAEAIIREAPMRERPRAALMLALYRSGRHAEALRAFQSFRDMLAEETGLEPSGELARLERRIVERDPSLDTEGRNRSIRGYELHEKIAEGAFGTIYRGVQPSVGREVAVKVINPELADDPRFIARFEAEAQLVARLEHPHIVPLHDYWREPGGAFLVMRYLRGGSAEERLVRQGPFAVEELSQVVDQVGTALALAHSNGIVHRDVKPSNVMFDEAGNAYLGDFGIAFSATDDRTGDAFRSAGTPMYAAPEQLGGDGASPASDQYAFAVLLWQLATAHVPFEYDGRPSLVATKLAAPLRSVRGFRPDLPAALDLVMQTATAPDPAERFADIGELVLAWRAGAVTPAQGGTTSLPGLSESSGRPRALASRTLVSLQEQRANPYKGLHPFAEADAAEFFGRGATTARLVEAATSSAFLAVVGPSGSGKSSVVRAGLIPALRQRGEWVATMMPGPHPFDELENALLRLAPASVTSLLAQLAADERGLVRAAKRILPDDDTNLVLVIDQLEELFTLAHADERTAFCDALVAAAADPRSRVRTVTTLRADFYDRPLAIPGLGELVRDHTLALTPLDADELEQAITGPADRVGVPVEPTLIAALVADATANPASLPLLQYTLTELYDRRDGGSLTLAAYRELGGLAGSVSGRADAICDEIGDLDAVRLLFERLVTPGEGAEDTRRRARTTELRGVPSAVVGAFGDARLLAFDHDPVTREPTVEVAHEALIRSWPLLREWLNEDRESLVVVRHLTDAADAWDARGREPGDLYRGARLAAAIDLVNAKPEQLSPVEAEFVAASHDAAQADDRRRRRNARRLRTLTVGLAITLVGALIAGAVAVTQRNESTAQRNRAREQTALAEKNARDAKIGEMAAQARALADSNNPQALLLALEADRLRPDVDTLGSLEVALLARPDLRTVHSGVKFLHVVPSLDGKTIAGGTVDGRVVEIDAESGRTIDEWKVSDGFAVGVLGDGQGIGQKVGSGELLARDSDGATRTLVRDGLVSTIGSGVVLFAGTPVRPGIAVATRSGVRIVDVTTGGTMSTFAGYAAGWLSISGDGRRLAIESNAAPWTVTTIDTNSGETVGPVVEVPFAGAVALNRSGDRLGIAGGGDARLVNVATGDILGTPLPGTRMQVAFSDDGALMAAIGQSNDVRVFNAADGTLASPDRKVDFGGAAGLFFSADGRRLRVVSNSGDIGVLDLSGGTKLGREVALHGYPFAFSPDGRLAAVASVQDNGVALIDVATARVVRVLRPARHFNPDDFHSTTFTPDGARVAVGSPASDGQPAEIEIFSTVDGRSERRLPVPGVPFLVNPSDWSPDSRVIAVAYGAGVIRVDATSGERLDDLALPEMVNVDQIAYSPDGRLFVAGDRGAAFVFDRSGQVIKTYRQSDHAYYTGRWGPNGTLVLPDYRTGEIRVVDPATDHQTGKVYAGPAGFAQVAVEPDGHGGLRGVAASVANVIWLWDVATGQQIGDPIEASSTPADGIIMNSTSALSQDTEHHQMILWDLDPGVWWTRACEAAGRNLTLDEWHNFLPEGEPYHATCPQYPAGD